MAATRVDYGFADELRDDRYHRRMAVTPRAPTASRACLPLRRRATTTAILCPPGPKVTAAASR